MTPHPIDTEALRDRMRRAVATAEEDGSGAYIDPRDLTALLDAIQYGIEHRKFLIGRLRGAKHRADNHEARAKAAEHRATRAEAQAEARRVNAVYWRERTGVHEARTAEEKRLRMKATAAATEAEARIKAVEEVLDTEEARPRPIGGGYDKRTIVHIADIRRALDV